MELLLKLFLIFSLFANTQYIKVTSIINFLTTFDKAQNRNYIKIDSFEFKEEGLKIEGFIKFKIEDGKDLEFKNFLKENGININKLDSGENTIYVYEYYLTNRPSDFKTNFLFSFYKIIGSKNFYLILILTLIFYLLILPNILRKSLLL